MSFIVCVPFTTTNNTLRKYIFVERILSAHYAFSAGVVHTTRYLRLKVVTDSYPSSKWLKYIYCCRFKFAKDDIRKHCCCHEKKSCKPGPYIEHYNTVRLTFFLQGTYYSSFQHEALTLMQG